MRRFVMAVLICLLLAVTGSAMAATVEMSLSWETEGQTVSVSLYKQKSGKCVLYLPGGCDASHLTVASLGKKEQLRWGDTLVRVGDTLDVSGDIGGNVELRNAEGNVRLDTVQIMQGSHIPALFFTIDKEDLTHVHSNPRLDIKKEATVSIITGDGSLACADQLTSFHIRGNSTRFAGKKAYQFKLEHKADLEGMGKSRTWILMANWFDISLLRNQITYDLCKEMGLNGTPECRQADVYLNGEYNGTYLLSEKIQLNKQRLDITNMEKELEELNTAPLKSFAFKSGKSDNARYMKWFDIPNEPEDITGGYLLEIEKELQYSNNKSASGFVTDGGMCIIIKEPTWNGKQATSYIAGIVNEFHNAVLAPDGRNPVTGKHYSEYADVRSFAMKIIIEELSANYDVRAASQFMYKDSDKVDSLLHAGPGWDYDLTYGNKDDGLRNPLRKDYVYGKSKVESHLYHWLLTHDDFNAMTRRLLLEEFIPAVQVLLGQREAPEGSYVHSLADYRDLIADSAAMNFTRWSARAIPDVTDQSGRTFEDANAFLEDFITQRIGMMESEWLAAY